MLKRISFIALLAGLLATDSLASSFDVNAIAYLRADLKMASVAAHVDVTSVSADRESRNSAECDSGTAVGYCNFLLTAVVKEVYKGRLRSSRVTIIHGVPASIKKERLLGEFIVFLFRDERGRLTTVENTIRRVEGDVLKRMRALSGRRPKR